MSINLSNRLSAITQDSAGITHLAWAENDKIWHATYDINARDWINAQVVVEFNGQSLKHLTIVADPKLITTSSSSSSKAPGVAIIYQEGIANDSEIFYTAAQYNSNGVLQWLPSPQALTADTIDDLEPKAIVNDGIVTVVGQKVNADQANNQAIREDTDLYYQTFSVTSSQFPTAPPSTSNAAPYAPRTVVDGVIQGNYPVVSIPQSASAAAYTPLTSKELQTAASSSSSYNGLGLNFNVSQTFDLNLAKAVLDKFNNLPGFFTNTILGNFNLGGTLQGSSGNNPNFSLFGGGVDTSGALLINSSGFFSYSKEKETSYGNTANPTFSKKPSGSVTGVLASLFSYTDTKGNYTLGTQTGSSSFTAGFSVPIPIPFIKATPFYLSAIGSLGTAIQWQFRPTNPEEYIAPIALGITAIGEVNSASTLLIVMGIPPLGAIAGIALAVLSPIEEVIEGIISEFDPDNPQAITPESLLFGLPIASIGLEGGVKIPFIFEIGVAAQFFAAGTIGETEGNFTGSLTVGIPLTATAKAFGYLGGTIGIFPTWTFGPTGTSSATLATPTLASSENTASVSGSLLRVSFPEGLDPTVNVDPSQFTVTVTATSKSSETPKTLETIPVFGAVISGNDVILRLGTSIPYTTQDGAPPPNLNINLTYTQNQTGQGVLLDQSQQPIASTNFSVTNNTPQTFTYNYNPVSGTGNTYAVNQQQVIIQFNTALDTSFIPDASQFTITDANKKSFTVNQVSLNNQRVLLTLSAPLTTSYTVTYTQNTNANQNLTTKTTKTIEGTVIQGTTIDDFNVDSANALTSVGLINRTFANSGPTNQLLANVANDFAQDTPPAMALVYSSTSTASDPIYDLLLAWSSDAPPLTPISAIISTNSDSNSIVILTFAQNIDSSDITDLNQLATQFTFSDTTYVIGNVEKPIGNTIVLNVKQNIPDNANLSLTYNLGSINLKFSLENSISPSSTATTTLWVPDFTVDLQNYSQVSSTTAPNILVAGVTTTQLTLVFDQSLDSSVIPDASQFTVISNNTVISVESGVTVNQNSVILPLNQGINQGDVVTVSYQAIPNGNNLQNNSNTLVDSFQNQSVISTPPTATTVIKTAFSPFGNSGISDVQSIIGTSELNFDPVAILVPNKSATSSTRTNIVAWVNVDSSAFTGLDIPGQTYTQSQADQINTAIGQSKIYYSQLQSGNAWTIAQEIPTPPGQNTNVALGIGPNQEIMAAWLNTSTTTGSTTTTIYWSSWTESSGWTPIPFNSGLTADPHTDLTISQLGGQPAIFWTSSQPSSYRELVESASPSIYLRLGELTGSTARNFGTFLGAANGTYTGTYTLNQTGALENTTDSTTTGDPNPAVLFNGGGVTLNQPIPLNNQGFSVEFWFKLPENPSQNLNLVSMAGVFGLGLEVIDSKPYLKFGLVNGESSAVQVDPGLEENVWYYVVGSYVGSTETLTLYLNGQPIGQQTQQNPTLPQSGILTLAGTPNSSVYLDEVAFYPAELTYANINANALTADNFQTVTATQLLEIISGTNQVGNHYTAQYNAPVAPGPQTFSAIWDGKAWNPPSLIEPKLAITPTSLSDANRPAWDIVSATNAESSSAIAPNGNSDSLFRMPLTNQQNKIIIGVEITGTVTTNDGQTSSQTWAVGLGSDEVSPLSGNQLGVVIGNRLLNNLNPQATTYPFEYPVLGAEEILDLYVDTGSGYQNSISSATITVYFANYRENSSTNSTNSTSSTQLTDQVSIPINSEPLTPGQVSVLGTATVIEANDSSLALIDSGFIIQTSEQGMGAVVASAFNTNNGTPELAYVAVGNRGLTNASGESIQGGTIQILLPQGPALTNSSSGPLTTNSINAGGILIEGITDNGEVNNNVAMSLATGDVNGDGIDDLVIGDANANNSQGAIYVIYGSYLVNNPNKIINVTTLTSDQGVAFSGEILTNLDIYPEVVPDHSSDINGSPGSLAGFAVAVGRFGGNSNGDISYGNIIFSAPLAKNGNDNTGTIVGKVFQIPGGPNLSSSIPSLIYTGQTFSIPNPQDPKANLTVGEIAGYSLAISRTTNPDGGAVQTYSGSSSYDDLIIGAPNYQVEITNQWTNKSNLPQQNQGNFPDTSWVSSGAAYVISGSSSGLPLNIITTSSDSPSSSIHATYTGINIPDSTGVGTNTFAGSNLTAGDLDGDGYQDLVISVPGLNANAGGMYVLSGKALNGGNSAAQAINTLNTQNSSGSWNAIQILGGLSGSRTGAVITFPGDLNGDHYQDLLITAPQAANGTGQSYVVFGSSTFFNQPNGIFDLNVTANNNKTTFLLNGNQPLQLAGAGATGVGDLNNDGVADLLLTAPNGQQLYAVYGHSWLADDGSIKLADISSDNGFVIDGYDYTLASSPYGYVLGFVLVSGSSGSLVSAQLQLVSPTGQVLWESDPGEGVVVTPQAYAVMQTDGNLVIYGQPGGNTGDVIWSSNTDGNSGAVLKLASDGGLYIVSQTGSIIKTLNQGNTSLINSSVTLNPNQEITVQIPTFLSNGTNGGSLLGNGRNVVVLGDVNGDGFADALSGGSTAGGVVVFGNSTKDLLDAALGTGDLLVSVNNAEVKEFVALGDFNGDGLADFGVIDSNKTFHLVLGSPSLGTLGNLTLGSNGMTLSGYTQAWGVGDFNGNGYDDLVLQGSNAAIVVYGNVNGTLTNSTPLNFGTDNPLPSSFTGIDLNGDGSNEIVAGQAQLNSVPNIGGFGGGLQYFTYESGKAVLQTTIDPPNASIVSTSVNPEFLNFDFLSANNQETKHASSFAFLDGWLYQALYGENNSIVMQRSRDGVHWQDSTEINLIGVNGDKITPGNFSPSIAAYNGQLYLGITDSSSQVWVAEASNTTDNSLGLNFSPVQINQASKNAPTLVAFNNELYVFFIKNDSDDDILYVSSSNPGSNDWGNNTVLTINGGNQASNQPLSAIVVPNQNGETLAVAFKSSDSSAAFVATLNSNNLSSWSRSSELSQVDTNSAPSLTFVNGIYYLSFVASNQNINLITSQDADGLNWSNVFGGPGGSEYNYDDLNGVSSIFFNQSILLLASNSNGNPASFVFSQPFFEPNQATSFGKQVYDVGDFNGDGIADLAVLAPGYRNLLTLSIPEYESINNLGGVFIYYGSSSGISITGSPDVVLAAPDTPDATNFALSEITSIGDVNGDGFDDLLISSPFTTISKALDSSSAGDQGVTWVVFGGTHWGKNYPITTPFNLGNLDNNQNSPNNQSSQSNNNQQNFNPFGFVTTGLPGSTGGISLAGGGDINGDGFSDFALGAPGSLDNLSYVLFGSDFTSQVNQLGTIGDDVMLGSPTGEIFVAGQGDDQIYSNGGVDTVYAGPGDDFVTVTDTNFRRLDGGSGNNILKFTGYTNQNWDLTTLSPGLRLKNFNILDVRDYGANILTLNALTITQLSANNEIRVLLDANDTLNLDSSFSFTEKIYLDNQNYYRYTSSASAATILVNVPNQVTFTAPNTNTPILNTIPTAQPSPPPTTNDVTTLAATSSDPNQPTRLFVSNPKVSEASGEAQFVIERTGNLNKYVLASYITQDMSGKAGDRYLPIAGQLIFNPGEEQKTVTVKIPNDSVYTADRQFGLLVSLLNDGLEAGNWGSDFALAGDANGAQIRRWNYLAGDWDNSVMGGLIDFSTTVNSGQTEIHLSVEGLAEFNDFFGYDSLSQTYQSLMFNDETGARFTNVDSPNGIGGVELKLLDGDRGDADGIVNGLVATNGYAGRTIPGLISNNNRVFLAPTNADGQVQLRLINSPSQNYEIGWVMVDSADGAIDGLLPDDPGYEEAALARKQVVFSDQANASAQALTRSLARQSFTDIEAFARTESQFFGSFSNSNLEANRYYMLYGQQGEEIAFSIDAPLMVETDSRGYHQLDFNGITTEIASKTLVVPGILNQTVTTNVSISRAGAYENLIVLYKVDSLTGGIDTDGDRQINLNPGDGGYLQAALTRAQNPATGLSLNAPDEFFSTTQTTVSLSGNNMYGMAIIPNSSIEEVLSKNPTNDPNLDPVALFSFEQANPGGVSQMSRLGSNLFGFEDMVGGGDLDYNDVILQFSFLTP
ncbi:hypothetical protein BWK47_03125 [Synechocystis sp. CACIAM 05]|nr:hypothetical protein BWK47_03125 [Synechocystis sp. CACIAM 05]